MVPWNEKQRCTGRSETIINFDSNDVLFMENVKQNKWVPCPSCYHYFERNLGCSSMKCRCKITFCYNCGEKACKCKNIPCWWQTNNIMHIFPSPVASFCARQYLCLDPYLSGDFLH
ncbi:hypothetical protein MKW98_000705 [Papaver atlanticum]|uniref:IBR domain-containing protein n=1 Tax=Papaver atlanticum TaxID=357466 RepID=A0AAD4X5X2_9MAGN|nr:hypothetical protein MKW98_000705 [Papaver atlanticum]